MNDKLTVATEDEALAYASVADGKPGFVAICNPNFPDIVSDFIRENESSGYTIVRVPKDEAILGWKRYAEARHAQR